MRDRLLVFASFLLIFSFSSVDSAISPMVEELGRSFQIPLHQVLLLISVCTSGVVVGIFLGPALTAAFSVFRLLAASGLGLTIGLIGFLLVDQFSLALALRFLFGLSSGITAGCLWWLTFYGVEKSWYQAMLTVLMSARPLATALGVPLIGMLAAGRTWQFPLWIMVAGIVLSAGVMVFLLRGAREGEKSPLSLRSILRDYREALTLPWAGYYYAGFTINRMCYFGFYAFSGIWFIKHYGLNLKEISQALFVIGVGEVIINFAVPRLRAWLGHKQLVQFGLLISALVFPFFISGHLPLWGAISLITLFMLLDRVYCMAIVITIPEMFPQAVNKTVFGSLNTLTAWGGLTLIAWIEAQFGEALGLSGIQVLLYLCFLSGSAMLYHVQRKTVLSSSSSSA